MRDIIREDARLVILRALAAEPRYSHSETILQATLETFGIARPRACPIAGAGLPTLGDPEEVATRDEVDQRALL